jgi:2-polyprenyl-3-methyl-5-hydroxy-6-metoxy-1,4-benzoquinol methylase
MKRHINNFLNSFGLELRRVKKKTKYQNPINRNEILQLEETLNHFALNIATSAACSDQKQLRSYLSNNRLNFFHELIELCVNKNIFSDNKRIADIGSGTGYLLRLIQKESLSAQLTGYDTFEEINLLAAQLCPTAEFHAKSIFEIQEHFDCLFCTEVLEHLTHPAEALKKMASLLLPGGKIILTVPNGRYDQHEALNIREDGKAYWGHIHFWSPESWHLFLKDTLSDVQIETGLLNSGENYAIIN